MNSILRKTHSSENIAILRARDYYFNRAKEINLLKSIIVFSLPFIIAVSQVPWVQSALGYTDLVRDIVTGALTLLGLVSAALIDRIIDKWTGISNMLREYYDWKVLDIAGECFIYDFSDAEKHLKMAKKVPYRDKYEVWYSEVFSSDKNRNILCCQLDNILYAIYAYRTTEKIYRVLRNGFAAVAVAALVWLAAEGNWMAAFFAVFSFLECFEVLNSKVSKLKESRERCTLFSNKAKLLEKPDVDSATITAMQHAVIANRALCIFLPKLIRNYFLKDNNRYYQALDAYKAKFWGEDSQLPEEADQIEAVSVDGEWGVPLSQLHDHLREMTEKVIQVFQKENIDYTLDGGTLIGAMRSGDFIPWDDDVDIAIPADQVEKAKAALRKHLSYPVQDADNEPFYSPRLAAFRVREEDGRSVMNEKDSALYSKFKHRGLFVDVYAYSPVLKSVVVDKLYRRLVLHPLNKRLKAVEEEYPAVKSPRRAEKRFLRLKKRYQRQLAFYRRHAKNEQYYAYFPEYIHDLQQPGPYHKKEELYGGARFVLWAGLKCRVPTCAEILLESYYGADWRKPPFASKEELQKTHGKEWYSKAKVGVTSLKHISNLVSVDDTYTKYYNEET